MRRAAAGHRGRVLRRPPHPRAATRGALRRGWRRGERPRAPPAPADAERRPGDRQRSHLPGHDGAGHDAVLPRETRPSGEAEAGTLPRCCRARGTDRNWTRVDRKMLWSPAASSSQQRARVLTDVKARRFAPPPLRGADGLDAGSAHARPDWLLPTMLTHTPPTCCGRRPVQNDALSGDR